MTRQNNRKSRTPFADQMTTAIYLLCSFIFAIVVFSSSAEAIEADDIKNTLALKGPVNDLKAAVDSFEVLETYCSDQEPKKVTAIREIQRLQGIADGYAKQVKPVLRELRNLIRRPVGRSYVDAYKQINLINTRLIQIRGALKRKNTDVLNANEIDCAEDAAKTQAAIDAALAGLNVEVEKEEVFQLHEANFYPVGTPSFASPFCTQGEKDNALVAISRERANAGFNINQADQVIWSIEAAQKTAQTDKGKQALATKLTAAKADRTARTKELDKLDAIYEAAKKLPIEDCTENATTALSMPNLGTMVYALNLKDYNLPTLKACYDSETERQRAAWEAHKAMSNALHNHHEWNKRRRSIEDALHNGQGNATALKAAQKEALVEAKKWDEKNKKADALAKEADAKPLCPKSQDNRTSMTTPPANQQMLDSLRRMTGASPWEQDLGVVVPPVYDPTLDASRAAANGNNGIRQNMNRAGALQNNRNNNSAMPNSASSGNRSNPPRSTTLNIPAGNNGSNSAPTPQSETIPSGTVPAANQQPTNNASNQNMFWPGSNSATAKNAGNNTRVGQPSETLPPETQQPTRIQAGNPNLTTQNAGTNVEVQQETQNQGNQETWVQVKPPVLEVPGGARE